MPCRVILRAAQNQQKLRWLLLVTVLGCSRCKLGAAQEHSFLFHSLTVVTSLWPAVWPVGCHPWKVALGA